MEFSLKEQRELKEYLYNACYIHDARIVSHKYFDGNLFIELENLIFQKNFSIFFSNVQMMSFVRTNIWSDNSFVSAIVLDDENYIECKDDDFKESLKILLELFSGEKIYVCCKKVEMN